MKPEPSGTELPLRWIELAPGGPGLYVPADPDEILARTTESEFRETDERMPYFSTLWPAGAALAAEILGGPRLDGKRVLDLGCGVGAVGIAAAWRGASVTFLDWEPRALAVVGKSLARQGLDGERIRADWRSPPALGTFDRVVAADVLYEERNLVPVVAFASEHVAPTGEAWIADPGRGHAADLVPRARAAGLRLLEERTLPTASRAEVRRFRFARGSASG